MSDFENRLQQYAQGNSGECWHPINKVVDMPNGDEVCTLCGKIFKAKPTAAEQLIAEAAERIGAQLADREIEDGADSGMLAQLQDAGYGSYGPQ